MPFLGVSWDLLIAGTNRETSIRQTFMAARAHKRLVC